MTSYKHSRILVEGATPDRPREGSVTIEADEWNGTPVPAPIRNGLPEWKPYVYRGTGYDTLTPCFGENNRKAAYDRRAYGIRHHRKRQKKKGGDKDGKAQPRASRGAQEARREDEGRRSEAGSVQAAGNR